MTDIVAPTPIDALPPAPQPGDTPEEFDAKSFAMVAAEVAMIPQQNALGANVFQNATAANERAAAADASKTAAQTAAGTATTKAGDAAVSATAAAGSATAASTSAGNAAGSASAAAGSATAAASSATAAAGSATAASTAKTGAEAARDAAKDYRDQAQVFATQQLKGSSTTSVTPGAGAKTFTIEAGRSFVVGMYLVATSTSDPSTQMSGPVQSYDGTNGQLVLAVDMFSGSTAKADWVIGVAAPGASSGLTRQVVTANTTCVAGVAYIVAASGITLTLPTTWNAGDKIAVIEAIGDGLPYSIAFGSTKLRTRTMGTQQIDSAYGGTGVLTYHDATRGLV